LDKFFNNFLERGTTPSPGPPLALPPFPLFQTSGSATGQSTEETTELRKNNSQDGRRRGRDLQLKAASVLSTATIWKATGRGR